MTRIKIITLLASLSVAVWTGVEMLQRTEAEMLWGWRPLLLLLSVWFAILLAADGPKLNANRRRWIILSSLSGLILSVGFPPSPLTPFMFIGLVPILMLENEISIAAGGISRWRVFKYAFNGFFIWNMCTTWWVLNTSFLPGIVANVLNAIFMAIVIVLYHNARHVLGKRMHWLILVAFWIGFEYLHIHWEISWPWLNLGHSFAQYPSWIQWYEYTGIFGGSMWILVVNYLIWSLYDNWKQAGEWSRSIILMICGVIFIPILFGVTLYYSFDLPEGDTEIVILQPNYEPHYTKFSIPQKQQLAECIELSESAITESTDYLIFPETTFGYVQLNQIERDYRIAGLRSLVSIHPKLKLITGLASFRVFDEYVDSPAIRMQVKGNDTTYLDVQNSAIQIMNGQEIDPYFKSKLVPGAEIFPFKKILPFIAPLIEMLDGSSAGHAMQDEREVFNSDVSKVAPVICYESIYGAYVGEYIKKGAGMLFIITNDGWWDNSPGHQQHLMFGRLRAIEHRRPIARSANTGISCFINERGDIIQPSKYGERTTVKGKLKATSNTITFYTQWGDVIARICAFMAVLFMLLTISRTVQRRNELADKK